MGREPGRWKTADEGGETGDEWGAVVNSVFGKTNPRILDK